MFYWDGNCSNISSCSISNGIISNNSMSCSSSIKPQTPPTHQAKLLLKFLISVIDTELLKTIDLKCFKTGLLNDYNVNK